MEDRVVLVLLLSALVLASVLAIRLWNSRRTRVIQHATPAWGALGVQPDGRATLIAFSSPSCAACHKAQAPAVDVAERRLGREAVRVINVDAARQPGVAQAFGVMTVPSTVVLAARGDEIVAINQGFAPSARLIEQLQRA